MIKEKIATKNCQLGAEMYFATAGRHVLKVNVNKERVQGIIGQTQLVQENALATWITKMARMYGPSVA